MIDDEDDGPSVVMTADEPTFPVMCFFEDCENAADRVLTWSNKMHSAMCADCAARYFKMFRKPSAGGDPARGVH